ncbi:unnamed protein product [Mytilus coruscus]|uniref:B box-type domain-containing protein n=1 Tax=Mytilus coruscus TaxID=42192 RepID=A0A6J8EA49_MYTCO|nr:unnamed protein product [Mytilus coruscus]
MALPSKDFCTLCKQDNVTSDAVTWCTECEVFVCEECEKHHKRSRTSKDHKTISAENYHELPSSIIIKETSYLCKVHDRRFELYCSFHACACCVQCIADKHQTCQTMNPLSDILKQVKSSAAVPLLEKDLNDLKENFDEIIEYLRSRIHTNAEQKTEAIQNIRFMRKSIDDYLSQLEQQILKDLEIEHSKIKSEMETLLHEVDKRANQITKLQKEFSNMTKYATELQTYVGLKEIEKITSQEGNYIEDLKRCSDLNERNLHVTTSPALASILRDVKSLGKISVDTRPCNVKANAGRNDQAQYLVPVPMIDHIKPLLLNNLKVPKERNLRIIDCCILPDGNIITLGIDDNNRSNCLLFKNDGTFIRYVMSFDTRPSRVCFVKDNTVAVTLYHERQLVIFDTDNGKVIRNVAFDNECSGVSCDGEVLIVSMPIAKNVCVMNLEDKSKHNLKGIHVNYISLFKGDIYSTNLWNNKVNCYKLSGELLWSFTHKDIIDPMEWREYTRVHFMFNVTSNGIVVVSPDGNSCRTILNHDNGIKAPQSIAIDMKSGVMLVSSPTKCNELLLFKL